jgi:hypothetical protein
MLKVSNTSLMFGVETFKMKGSFLLQNILRFLGRKFYLKNKKGERLAFIHSNISTITFAQLGIQKGVRSGLYLPKEEDKIYNVLFNIQNTTLYKSK